MPGAPIAAVGRTIEDVATEWFEHQKERWKPVHANDVIGSLTRDLFPTPGALPINGIDKPMLLATLCNVEARGAIETAHRLRQRAEGVFRYAKASGLCVNNPASAVIEAMMPKPAKKRWLPLTEREKVRDLVRAVDEATAAPVTRLASRFVVLTAQRPGLIHRAPWSQIDGIDWERPDSPASAAEWRIGAAEMKQELSLRADDEFDHVVPSAPETVVILRMSRTQTGKGRFIFPSATNSQKLMSENALNALYNRLGYKGVHVAHGWRSSFSTMLNERAKREDHGDVRLLIDRLIIDLMLAHRPSGMSGSEFR